MTPRPGARPGEALAMSIPLSDGTYSLVDIEDFETYKAWRWFPNGNGYASRQEKHGGRAKKIYLHREIAGAPAGFDVDHINRDRLDNRRSNLRVVTRELNMQNRTIASANSATGILNVSYETSRQRYAVAIGVDKRQVHIGRFRTLEAAIEARDEARKRLMPNAPTQPCLQVVDHRPTGGGRDDVSSVW